MPATPHAYIEYWPKEHPNVAHFVPMGDGKVCVLETEEAATLLAETMAECNELKHDGHGAVHSQEEIDNAFKDAIDQINNKDFEAEWAELQRRIAVSKKWGGTPPDAMIMPKQGDPGSLELMIPDRAGNPTFVDVRKDKFDMPDPRELGAEPNNLGIGWDTKRRWSGKRRLKYLAKRGK
tara:strand:+ start:16861 stop:17397 length:537 start_codon:yes stop_codon:yes gene_type:complete